MTITSRHALVTGGSRGIGRGIALKLAEHGVHVAINYLRDEASAKATLEQVRAQGTDGFIVQADVSQPAEVERLFRRVRDEFGSLDIFINNARGEVATFYEPAMSISLDKFDAALDSQAKAFLVGVREAEKILSDGGRATSTCVGRTWPTTPRTSSRHSMMRCAPLAPRSDARGARHPVETGVTANDPHRR